ncbi:hypothetical protein CVT24_009787 [Panaeolus cyanescens]|uniref:Lethal giant larvae (Lgl)-like C-terminal domain-containing protein n=1 Tax=Panaeolus cyanescens TaxID=181874 RepID=A0A409VEN8_9AGAR|nr:hypothetical protein CVT24_009787 [Panaeolus cyanescens]
MIIFTISHSGTPPVWNASGEPITCKGISQPLQDGLFVIDSKTGQPLRADRSQLSAAFRNVQAGNVKGTNPLLVSVGSRGMRTAVAINGERVAKVDWSQKYGDIESAQIVERLGSHALVIQTDHNEAFTYSLPHLEYLHTIKLANPSPLPLSIDDTGDYICWVPDPHVPGRSRIKSAIYGTFFDFRRVYDDPNVDFACTRGTIPAQPQPVSLGPASIIGSFFTFNQTLSGAQIDELLGGPNRPVLQRKVVDRNAQAAEEAESSKGGTDKDAGAIAAAAGAQTGLYDRLTSALSERGQMLGDLEERFNSLQEGSKDMVAQAKRLAAQQSAKSWFGF